MRGLHGVRQSLPRPRPSPVGTSSRSEPREARYDARDCERYLYEMEAQGKVPSAACASTLAPMAQKR